MIKQLILISAIASFSSFAEITNVPEEKTTTDFNTELSIDASAFEDYQNDFFNEIELKSNEYADATILFYPDEMEIVVVAHREQL